MAHFIFQRLNSEGAPTGDTVSCKTAAGVILQCPPKMNVNYIRHLCAIARETANYPVDICLWEGAERLRLLDGAEQLRILDGAERLRRLVWQARISWFNGDTGEHRVLSQAGESR